MFAGAGCPPPGLDFLDSLHSQGALLPVDCSFPRMGCAAGGLETCDVLGQSVLHLGCAGGARTALRGLKLGGGVGWRAYLAHEKITTDS